MSASVAIPLRGELSELAVMSDVLEDFAGKHHVDDQVMLQMKLALEELITNVITHAAGGERDCQIEVRLTLMADELTAELSDDAAPFDPLEVPAPDLDVGLEERGIGGLGIHLVRTLMDDVRYRRADDRNHVTLVKRQSINDTPPDGDGST